MKCIQSPPEENEQACIYMQVNLKLLLLIIRMSAKIS